MKKKNNSNVRGKRYIRPIALFIGVTCLHFLLSVAGTVLSLRASFDAQISFWAVPGEATLAFLSDILLAPLVYIRLILPVEWQGGYVEIATVSIFFGTLVVGLLHLARVLRPRRQTNGIRKRVSNVD